MTEQDWKALSIEVGKVFTPAAPIDEEALFAGRVAQLRQVFDVINQKGQHAIIFGERGVGKTSLSNMISKVVGGISGQMIAPRVNCIISDSFSSVWSKIFEQIKITKKVNKIGFQGEEFKELIKLAEEGQTITPDKVRQLLTFLSEYFTVILVIDEFDRINQDHVRTEMADTIKTLSDNAVGATIVLVGVGDSADQLIKEHQSVERALVQIQMPRMSKDELNEILEKGSARLKIKFSDEAKNHISLLSQGLPHYTHLVGLNSAREAIDMQTKKIDLSHVDAAIRKALQMTQSTIQSAYHKAVMSAHRDNIFSQVLLSCALANTDELGYFAAADVRTPLNIIIKDKAYDIPSFSRHLNDFCDEGRGPILQKTGVKHRFRFRFINPLMQPYVVMQGFANGLIDRDSLESK